MPNDKCQIAGLTDRLPTKTVSDLIWELALLRDQSAEVEIALPGMGTIRGMGGKTATVRQPIQFRNGRTVLLCTPAEEAGSVIPEVN